MKQGSTELVFILDRSGSMTGLESDTIGGYNSMLEKQQKLDGECRITTVLFDDRYELLHDRIDIRAVSPIDATQYFVRGSTALLDAVGRTIHKIASAQQHTAAEYRADKVMVVIITDGYENASREYSLPAIKSLIEREKNDYGWEFIFLGANIDAIETAGQFGISADRAQNYHADRQGTAVNFAAIGSAAACLRTSGRMPENWAAEVREDYETRK